MSIQGVFNTQVTKSSGIWTASAFVQFTALLVCLGAWLCTERTSFLKVWQVEPNICCWEVPSEPLSLIP